MTLKTCPICTVPLESETYEGFPVRRCPNCQGHLLDLSRYESIKRIPEKSLAELEVEAQAGYQGDNPEPIRCPRCHLAMTKKPLKVPGFDLHMDACRGCALIWLDGGELAMAQLAYQGTPAFQNAQQHKQRANALETDPERKAAFEEALSEMPQENDPFSQGLKESIRDALLHILSGTTGRWIRL